MSRPAATAEEPKRQGSGQEGGKKRREAEQTLNDEMRREGKRGKREEGREGKKKGVREISRKSGHPRMRPTPYRPCSMF